MVIEEEKYNPYLQFKLTNSTGRKLITVFGSLGEINEKVNKVLPSLEPDTYIIKVRSGLNVYTSRLIKKSNSKE